MTYFVMALALVLGLAQCKKDNATEQTINEGGKVSITLDVDNGGNNGTRANVTPPNVSFVEGDRILVAYDGKYVGHIDHNGTCFTGTIDATGDNTKPLYFYFLGNKADITGLTEGSSTTCTVNISDQSDYPHLPVISMAPSDQFFPSEGNHYSAHLLNKCSLMKFNVTTPSSSAICITGMNNTVSVNFATIDDEHDNGFSYAMNGIGEIKMKGQEGTGEKTYWAIVLPQASVAIGNAYTADRAYIGTRPAIEGGIGTDQFLNAGFSMTVNTELSSSTPLTLEALTDGTIKVNNPKNGMQYTLNDGGKSTVTTADIQVSAGDKVQFYGNGTSITSYSGTSIAGGTADVKAYGNIMSLIDEENYATATTLSSVQAFRWFFQNNVKLTDASSLLLPATTLAAQCYQYMFAGCTSLTVAPALPAETLASAQGCYSYMFQNCTSLTAAPALPAETLDQSCYAYMFNGCSSLTTAPALPATVLRQYCYQHMFNGCSSLTTAPALPATVLALQCYYYMFNGCSSLTTAPALPAETLARNCYAYMFSGCKSLTAAPALPAMTMVRECYQYMFKGCTSLTTAPALPATTLDRVCYANMFNGCTSLTAAPAQLPALTLAQQCYQNMFDGCTSLTTAPALPAETLANYCYQYMFRNCTSLTTAPTLPATTLASGCYANMFNGCSNLSSITCLATSIGTGTTSNWVNGVAGTGTFTKASGVNWTTGVNGIPEDWEVEVAQ